MSNASVPRTNEPPQGEPHTNKPTKDDTDLVAAALGLRSSAWAKAVLHLTPVEFNFAINGEQVDTAQHTDAARGESEGTA